MSTRYHIFLGPIASKHTAVIVNIGRETTDDNEFVVNVIKMYREWCTKVRFNKDFIRNIQKSSSEAITLIFSDIYWVHRALEQCTIQHRAKDRNVDNIISLCQLIVEHITKKITFTEEKQYNLTDNFVNILFYLCDLSVSWCLDKKYPILKTSVDDYNTPSVEEVYDSISYYCG